MGVRRLFTRGKHHSPARTFRLVCVRYAESNDPQIRFLILSDNLEDVQNNISSFQLCVVFFVWFQGKFCLVIQVDRYRHS